MNKKTRFLSALLALALCLSCMALPAFAEGENDPQEPTPSGTCICQYHCSDAFDTEMPRPKCYYCDNYYKALRSAGKTEAEANQLLSDACQGSGSRPCICPADGSCMKSGCVVCWRVILSGGASVCRSGGAAPKKEFVADVSGNYRTTAEHLYAKLKPAEIAQQELYIDPVTNTIVNLYDADGNLITATLSSDGHFYIVPDSSGNFVYIPTGN